MTGSTVRYVRVYGVIAEAQRQRVNDIGAQAEVDLLK
jgi:hypothetical protein